MNNGLALSILRRLGIPRNARAVILRTVLPFLRSSWLTDDDIWAEAFFVVWSYREARSIEALKMRLRSRLLRLIQRERRATGHAAAAFFWPWYRPQRLSERRCACGAWLPPIAPRKRCIECSEAMRRTAARERQARYRARKKAEANG